VVTSRRNARPSRAEYACPLAQDGPAYLEEVKDPKKRHVLPARFGDQPEGTFAELYGDVTPDQQGVRLVADIISRMTDREALTMHRRLRGVAPGSVRDGVF